MPVFDAVVVGAVAEGTADVAVAGAAAGVADAAIAGTAADVIGSDWAAGVAGSMAADGAGAIGASGGIWGDLADTATNAGADSVGSDWAAGNPGSMISNSGGLVGANSPQWLNWINQYKTPLTIGGDALKGIGGAINGAQNRQTALQLAQMNAQAPTDQLAARRAMISGSMASGPLPFQPSGGVLTRPDGTPVYIKGTGIVGQANGSTQ